METKAKDRSGFTLHTWREKLAWVRKHGIKAYLTWATVDEAIGAPLRTSTIFWRWMFEHVLTWKYVYQKWSPYKAGDSIPWYMGIAWINYTTLNTHAMIMPINLLVGWMYRVRVFMFNPCWRFSKRERELKTRQEHKLSYHVTRLLYQCSCGAEIASMSLVCPAMAHAMRLNLNTVIKSEPYRKYNKEKGVAPLDPLYRQGFDAGYMHAMGNVEKHIELRAFQLSSLVERRMEREGTEHVMVVGNTVSPLNCSDDVHEWGAWYLADARVNETKRDNESHRKCTRCGRVERFVASQRENTYLPAEYKKALRDPKAFQREYEGTFATALPKGIPHASGKYHPTGKTCNGCGEPILFDDHFQIYEEGIFHKRCAER